MVRYFTWGAAGLEGNDSSQSCCPININLLCMLKTQLAGSNSYTSLEQHLLWAAFSLTFNDFMRVSEFTSPLSSNSFSTPGLHWSDEKHLSSFTVSYLHHVSRKQIPFRRVNVLASRLPIHLPSQYVPALLCRSYTAG